MNARIRNLFGLVVLLFAVLIGFTSYWSVFDADELEANRANKRPLLEQQRIRRGLIFAARRHGAGPQPWRRAAAPTRFYRRIYPQGDAVRPPGGLQLRGARPRRARALLRRRSDRQDGRVRDDLRRAARQASARATTSSRRSTRRRSGRRVDALAGRAGSVVAIEPQTGRVLRDGRACRATTRTRRRRHASPTCAARPARRCSNRATQSGYPPGSTFKVVTATAALDCGQFTPHSVVNGKSPKEIGGVPLSNFGNESFGPITLTRRSRTRSTRSGRQVGEKLGKRTMYKYMRRFGFDRKPPIDLPAGRAARRAASTTARQAARRSRRDRHRPCGDRAGAPAGDAAADGDGGRRDRQRRAA